MENKTKEMLAQVAPVKDIGVTFCERLSALDVKGIPVNPATYEAMLPLFKHFLLGSESQVQAVTNIHADKIVENRTAGENAKLEFVLDIGRTGKKQNGLLKAWRIIEMHKPQDYIIETTARTISK